jgi:stage II sporulation protein P
VPILHTHATEAFSGGDYSPTSAYHTLNTQQNMVSIGAHLADLLQAGGIQVLQDTALHDTPSYNASYNNSRESIQKYLQEYPSIRLVLDLHRDSIEDAAGNQVAQTVFSQGTALAPLMFVVGTDEGGLTHPQWQENLSLALKLQVQLEDICPGICRNINLRTQRFNQDLSPGAMLVEVGASGNTRQEALRAAEILVKAIVSLAYGSSS